MAMRVNWKLALVAVIIMLALSLVANTYLNVQQNSIVENNSFLQRQSSDLEAEISSFRMKPSSSKTS